jgi:hypothetical protein
VEVLLHEGVVRVPVVAVLVDLGEQALGRVEVALQHGDDVAVDGGRQAVARHVEAFAHGDEGPELVEVARIALLELGDPAQRGGEQLRLAVARSGRDLAYLDGERLPLARGAQAPDGVVARPQAEGQGVVVLALPGQLLGAGDQVPDQLVVRHRAVGPAHQPLVRLADQLAGPTRPLPARCFVPVDGERHPGQQLRVVEPAGQRGRVLEVPAALLPGAAVEQLLPEVERDPHPAGRVLDHLQRPPEVPDGLLGGQPDAGVLRRRDQELHRTGGFQLGAGEVGVACQVGGEQPPGERGPVDRLDHRGVPAASPRFAERVVQRLPDQVVREREPAGLPRHDEPGTDRPAQQPVHLGRRGRGARRQHVRVELLSEHRRGGEQLHHRLREQRQPAAHGVADPGRDRGDGAARAPQPRRLLHEERVAAGAPVDLGDHLRVGLAARRAGDQRADLVAVQAGQRDRGRLGHQRQQQRLQRVPARFHLDVAVGADQQQPLEPGVLRGELQQPQRGAVGPVQVVEDDDDRAALGDRHQRGGDGVVQLEGLGPRGVVRRPGIRRRGRRLAEQDRQADAAGGPGRRPLLGRGGPPQRAEHLHPRPVARGAVGLPAGAAEHQRAAPPGLFRGVGDQRGLADPGLPGDQHQPAVAVDRPADLRTQQPGGMLPPDDALAARRAHANQCSAEV